MKWWKREKFERKFREVEEEIFDRGRGGEGYIGIMEECLGCEDGGWGKDGGGSNCDGRGGGRGLER